ncbi:MAG: hypothetical protein GXO73_05495 [Calditrichaeota bacterium]|nr:hypothetical protein [Calditrichota bacterium]
MLLVAVAVPALSQPSLDFSGYVVNFLMIGRIKPELARWWGVDQQQTINLTRVRLRPTLYLWDDARLALEYEADGFRFSSPLPYFEVPEDRPRQVLDLSWEPVNEQHFRLLHFVDRLYYRQDFGFGNLIVGRQRISWGTGRVWNPTDFFNPVNPAAFYKLEKDGADAVSFKWYLGDFSDLQLVYNAEDHWERRNLAARLRLNWRGVDYSLVAGRIAGRVVAGGDFAGSLGGAGVRGEVAFAQNEDVSSDHFWKAIFGMDYQFTPLLYGLFEYHYNGQGARDEGGYWLLFPQLLRGEILNLARNYLFVQGIYQIHPLVLVGVAHNRNLDDHSGFWLATATLSTSDNSSVTLGAQVFYGRRLTEYWYFPSAVYLQGEWYF